MDLKELNETLLKFIEESSDEYKHNLKVAEDAIKQILLPEVKQEVIDAKLTVQDNAFIINAKVVERYSREIQNGEQIKAEKANLDSAKKEIEISLKNTVEALKSQLPECNIDTDIIVNGGNLEIFIELSGKKLYTEIKESINENEKPGWVPEEAKNAIIDLYNKDKNHWLIDRITLGYKDVGGMIDFFDKLQEEGMFITNDKQTLLKIQNELRKYGLETYTKEVVAKRNVKIPGWWGTKGNIIETRLFCA